MRAQKSKVKAKNSGQKWMQGAHAVFNFIKARHVPDSARDVGGQYH